MVRIPTYASYMSMMNQTLSTKELMGCVLMFAAIILVQLPDRAKK